MGILQERQKVDQVKMYFGGRGKKKKCKCAVCSYAAPNRETTNPVVHNVMIC